MGRAPARRAPASEALLVPRSAAGALPRPDAATMGGDTARRVAGHPRRSRRPVAGGPRLRQLSRPQAGPEGTGFHWRRGSGPSLGRVLLLQPWRPLRRQPQALPAHQRAARVDRAVPDSTPGAGNLLLADPPAVIDPASLRRDEHTARVPPATHRSARLRAQRGRGRAPLARGRTDPLRRHLSTRGLEPFRPAALDPADGLLEP